MKFALLALCIPLALAASLQTQKTDAGAAAARTPTDPSVYSGHSIDGNLQAALNDALVKAQAAVTKTVADAQFNWELARVSGKRGGITGSQEVFVEVRLLK